MTRKRHVLQDRAFRDREGLGAVAMNNPRSVDVAVVGAGVAGISAALHAAAAGLSVTLLEAEDTVGGAASQLARVEVVPGSPIGMTGLEWTRRAGTQVTRAGVEIRRETRVVGLRRARRLRELGLADGSTVAARTVIAATGAEAAPFVVPGAQELCGAGVYWGMPTGVPTSLADKDVVVTGEPNAAVAAALHLARTCRSALVLSAEAKVGAYLSDELVRQVRATLNVSARPCTEFVEIVGIGGVEAVILRDRNSGRVFVRPAAAVFVLEHEAPRSQWLAGAVALDPDGRVVTGAANPPRGLASMRHRVPQALESSAPGVFAAGAVRALAKAGVAGAIEDGIAAARDVVRWLHPRRMPGDLVAGGPS